MSYYRENMRRLISQRAGDWLLKTKNPRLVATSAIALSMLTFGTYTFYIMTALVQSFGVAFGLASCLSYLTFILILAIWLQTAHAVDWRTLSSNSTVRETGRPGQTDFDKGLDRQIDSATDNALRNSDGVIEFAVMTTVFGIVYISVHYVYHAPYYLGQLLFDSGKISHRIAPPAKTSAIITEPIRQSWIACFMLVLNFACVGLLLDTIH